MLENVAALSSPVAAKAIDDPCVVEEMLVPQNLLFTISCTISWGNNCHT